MIPPVLTKGVLAFAIAAAVIPSGSASDITFASLPGNNTSFGTAADYLSNWNSLKLANPVPPAGYGTAPISLWDFPVPGNISNQGLIPGGTGVEIAYHYQVRFHVDPSEAGTFDFRIAPDFGMGGAAFLNGVAVAHNSNDMWWSFDWNQTSQLFEFSEPLAAGDHVLDFYGQEVCCDGPTAAQFRINGGNWTAFGSQDGLNVIPESAALPFLAPATALTLLYRVRRRARS